MSDTWQLFLLKIKILKEKVKCLDQGLNLGVPLAGRFCYAPRLMRNRTLKQFYRAIPYSVSACYFNINYNILEIKG